MLKLLQNTGTRTRRHLKLNILFFMIVNWNEMNMGSNLSNNNKIHRIASEVISFP